MKEEKFYVVYDGCIEGLYSYEEAVEIVSNDTTGLVEIYPESARTDYPYSNYCY